MLTLGKIFISILTLVTLVFPETLSLDPSNVISGVADSVVQTGAPLLELLDQRDTEFDRRLRVKATQSPLASINLGGVLENSSVKKDDTPENDQHLVRVQVGENVSLPCFNDEGQQKVLLSEASRLLITWWFIDEKHTQIGLTFIDEKASPSQNITPIIGWSLNETFSIGGTPNITSSTLLVRNARREVVESYVCVVQDAYSGRVLHRRPMHLRLYFADWFDGPWSLFYGSLIMAFIFCLAFILLNIIWVGLRNFALWWIRRLERLSRVRAMITMVEKYKQKQLDALHETYHRRVSNIRENYHSQLEQLRQSYASQTDRFREWGQAGRDNVQQHFDTIRDNYNQQVTRLRDFGSRRTERIWESYDRRMTAIRAFTLQQRLRIANQYKVKQRYVNKLLEAIADSSNVDTIRQKEAAIRAVLDDIPTAPPSPPPGPSEPLLVATKIEPLSSRGRARLRMNGGGTVSYHHGGRVARSASVPSVFHGKHDEEDEADQTDNKNKRKEDKEKNSGEEEACSSSQLLVEGSQTSKIAEARIRFLYGSMDQRN